MIGLARFMKTLVTLQFLCGWETAFWVSIYWVCFSRLYWLLEDNGPLHLLNSLRVGNGLQVFSFWECIFRDCISSSENGGLMRLMPCLHAFSDILVRLIANRDTGYPRRLTSFHRQFGEICAMQKELPVAQHYCNMGGRTAQCRNCSL